MGRQGHRHRRCRSREIGLHLAERRHHIGSRLRIGSRQQRCADSHGSRRQRLPLHRGSVDKRQQVQCIGEIWFHVHRGNGRQRPILHHRLQGNVPVPGTLRHRVVEPTERGQATDEGQHLLLLDGSQERRRAVGNQQRGIGVDIGIRHELQVVWHLQCA